MVDHYSTLELERTASQADVKKAYKKLARKWHPDKNPKSQDEATRKFKELSEAYQVLSDEKRRKTYDLYGKDGPDGAGGNGRNRSSGNNPQYETYYNYGRPGSDKSRTRQARRKREQPEFRFSSSFIFRDPEDVFKEFFHGVDPFADFFEPFGLGRPRRSRNESAAVIRNPRSIFGVPSTFDGFSTSFGLGPRSTAMHGGPRSIFDEFDRIFEAFDRFDVEKPGKPAARSPSCDTLYRRPTRRSYRY